MSKNYRGRSQMDLNANTSLKIVLGVYGVEVREEDDKPFIVLKDKVSPVQIIHH